MLLFISTNGQRAAVLVPHRKKRDGEKQRIKQREREEKSRPMGWSVVPIAVKLREIMSKNNGLGAFN